MDFNILGTLNYIVNSWRLLYEGIHTVCKLFSFVGVRILDL